MVWGTRHRNEAISNNPTSLTSFLYNPWDLHSQICSMELHQIEGRTTYRLIDSKYPGKLSSPRFYPRFVLELMPKCFPKRWTVFHLSRLGWCLKIMVKKSECAIEWDLPHFASRLKANTKLERPLIYSMFYLLFFRCRRHLIILSYHHVMLVCLRSLCVMSTLYNHEDLYSSGPMSCNT